jgi:hypothetical protein
MQSSSWSWLAAFVVGLGAVAHAAETATEQPEVRIYTMADQGLLTLMVPRYWSDGQSELVLELPRTIRFSARDGRFEVLFSGRWSSRLDPVVMEPDFVFAVTAYGAKVAAAQAAEPEVEVKPLNVASGEAYVYSVTDKDPKPGEYRYLTQGAVNVQGLICTFTILTQEQDSPAVAEAIEMIGTASFVYN